MSAIHPSAHVDPSTLTPELIDFMNGYNSSQTPLWQVLLWLPTQSVGPLTTSLWLYRAGLPTQPECPLTAGLWTYRPRVARQPDGPLTTSL